MDFGELILLEARVCGVNEAMVTAMACAAHPRLPKPHEYARKVHQHLQIMVAGIKLNSLVEIWIMAVVLRCGCPQKYRRIFDPDHFSLASVQLKLLKV